MSIEKELFPNSGKLIENNGEFTAQIIDGELDPIQCTFKSDGCVELNTEDLTYITLTYDNLVMMLEFLDEVEL